MSGAAGLWELALLDDLTVTINYFLGQRARAAGSSLVDNGIGVISTPTSADWFVR